MDDRDIAQQLARNDLDRFRLRNFIEELGDDELDVRNDPVDLAEVAEILHGNPKAVWFRNVNGASLQLVGNVVGSRCRLARAFGVAPDKILAEIQRRLKLAPELIELSQIRSAGAGGGAHRRGRRSHPPAGAPAACT